MRHFDVSSFDTSSMFQLIAVDFPESASESSNNNRSDGSNRSIVGLRERGKKGQDCVDGAAVLIRVIAFAILFVGREN